MTKGEILALVGPLVIACAFFVSAGLITAGVMKLFAYDQTLFYILGGVSLFLSCFVAALEIGASRPQNVSPKARRSPPTANSGSL